MLKHTSSGHSDYTNLQGALQQMKELADYINLRKHDADETNKILSIQERITNWPVCLFFYIFFYYFFYYFLFYFYIYF